MQIGQSVRWTSSDDEGTFSHVGVITNVNETWIDLKLSKPEKGMLNLRRQDGTFEVLENVPTSLDTLDEDVTASSDTVETTQSTAPKAQKAPKAGSKIERAVTLIKTNPTFGRKELIALFMTELGMSSAGASTYVHNARTAIKNGH